MPLNRRDQAQPAASRSVWRLADGQVALGASKLVGGDALVVLGLLRRLGGQRTLGAGHAGLLLEQLLLEGPCLLLLGSLDQRGDSLLAGIARFRDGRMALSH